MFPKALAQQFEKFFVAIFRRLVTKEVNQLIKQIAKDPDFKKPEFKTDTLESITVDINRRSKKFKRFADSKQLEKLIRKRMKGFDAWSKSRIEMSLKRSVREIKFGVSGLKKIGSASLTSRAVIGIELQEAGVTAARLDALVKTNVELIKTTSREVFPKIESIVKQGVQQGFSNKMTARLLRKELAIGERRAKFWARDQTAKAVSGFNKDRQMNAGIPGFIWRHQKDNLVRGNPGGLWPDAENPHWDQEGKFFTWEKGWSAPDGRILFPGTDFNCRCFPEPAFGPEQAEKAA